MVGYVIKRRDFKSAMLVLWVSMNTRMQLHREGPAHTFDWVMGMSEQHLLKSALYFIYGHTDPSKDAEDEFEHPAIRELMRSIHQRGHAIGLHPSHNSYQSPPTIAKEAARLRRVAQEEGIEQAEWSGRMHYSHWEHPTTLQAWDQAGLAYDSTLICVDRLGFKCGTCFEYRAFDPASGQGLELRIPPLIAMGCAVMAPRYMGLGEGEGALNKFLELKRACQAFGGRFTHALA
jgi:hypothetical protein